MNKIIIIGNLAADPEAHVTQGGILRSTMRVAVNRPYKREEADFLLGLSDKEGIHERTTI